MVDSRAGGGNIQDKTGVVYSIRKKVLNNEIDLKNTHNDGT